MLSSTTWIWNILPALIATLVVGCYAQRIATTSERVANEGQ